jgi:hypothetical protein
MQRSTPLRKRRLGNRGGNANWAGDIGYGRFMSRKPTSDTAAALPRCAISGHSWLVSRELSKHAY